MKVINHFLFGDDGKQIPYKPSPNHGGIKIPQYLIIHYDGSSNATGAISWMLSPTSKVSAELHITRDGKVTQLVPFNIIAWHAGKSEWKGLTGLNSHSIGIELQNSGNQEYTDIQMKVLVAVGKALFEAYQLKDTMGHRDISPGRKIDPGDQFPMEWFKKQIGLIEENMVEVAKTSADLNLRTGAGIQHSIVSILPKGTEVNILDMTGEWSHIFVCSSKLIGFVKTSYLNK